MGRRPLGSGNPPSTPGPSIAAVALWASSKGEKTQLLTDKQRARLAVFASVVRFNKGTQIYREGDNADAVFNIIDGVVKGYTTLRDETERISAFLFANDLFGLAQDGKYANSAKAVTAVTAYRLPASALESRLRADADLEFQVICKLCQDLREAQRHAILLARRNALAKVAMFFQMLGHHQAARDSSELYLPMSRSDIADYVGMSPEAVSRSFRTLASRGVISFKDKRNLKIVDHAQLELAAQLDTPGEHQGRPRRR